MSDVIFLILGYGVILGGLAGYAVLLIRRLGIARSTDRDDPEA
jgi:hypothetical protein